MSPHYPNGDSLITHSVMCNPLVPAFLHVRVRARSHPHVSLSLSHLSPASASRSCTACRTSCLSTHTHTHTQKQTHTYTHTHQHALSGSFRSTRHHPTSVSLPLCPCLPSIPTQARACTPTARSLGETSTPQAEGTRTLHHRLAYVSNPIPTHTCTCACGMLMHPHPHTASQQMSSPSPLPHSRQ